ncbi:hypothetical protein [Comamonas koreensis]|uniref:hypothetical protein n=1 Tax=Comamonas koreensis TaxID=160825 RepID=UPI0015FB6120|nr:hypothetical protein [Comamonas koreensis]
MSTTQIALDMNIYKIRSIGLLAVLAISTLVLTGCSSAEDKVYKAFRCAKVASLLGKDAAAKRAMATVTIEMEKLSTSTGPTYLGIRMNERFQDDVPLYRYGPRAQAEILTKAFESSECQKYYK